jgi:chromosome segregation ATPase
MSYTLEQVAELGWLSPDEAARLRGAMAHAEAELDALTAQYADLNEVVDDLMQRYQALQTELQQLARDRQEIEVRLERLEGRHSTH